MSEILTYDWNFGDGNTSSLSAPTNVYTTGWYTVELKVLTSLGYYSTITKEYYIKVQESNVTNFNSDYLNGKTSLHFGWNNETSYGWSENTGDNWIWAESKGAVMDFVYLGNKYKLVWDLYTDKQYVINTGTGRIEEEFTDKAVDGNDGYDIESIITLPEFNGEKESFTLSHMQTDVFFKSLSNNNALPSDFKVDVALYDANGVIPVETKEDINIDAETVFYYQSANTESNNYRQVEITASQSDYKLLSIESMFKVEDRSRVASYSVDTIESSITNVSSWFTRGQLVEHTYPPYGLDKVVNILDNTYDKWTTETGVDGSLNTAGKPSTGTVMTLNSFTTGNTGTIILWARETDPTNIFDGYTFTACGDAVGVWNKYCYTGVISSTELTVSSALPILFDVRVYDTILDAETIAYYFDNYQRFLPRY